MMDGIAIAIVDECGDFRGRNCLLRRSTQMNSQHPAPNLKGNGNKNYFFIIERNIENSYKVLSLSSLVFEIFANKIVRPRSSGILRITIIKYA